jgi:hypothetical protein
LHQNTPVFYALKVITSLDDNHYSVVKGDWHYINYDGMEEELYNLVEDPEEWTNLALKAAHESVKRRLKEMIPKERHELVPTDPIRWADVLSGKIQFCKE